MPRPTNLNEKPAEATIPGGLEFFSTTLRPQQKDAIDDFLYHGGARVNER